MDRAPIPDTSFVAMPEGMPAPADVPKVRGTCLDRRDHLFLHLFGVGRRGVVAAARRSPRPRR